MKLSTIFMLIALTAYANHIYAKTLANITAEKKLSGVNYGARIRYFRKCFAKICSPPLKKKTTKPLASLGVKPTDLKEAYAMLNRIQIERRLFDSVFFSWYANSIHL